MIWLLWQAAFAQTTGSLDGVDDYWSVSTSTDPNPGDSYTIEAWVMTTDPSLSQTLLAVQHPSLGFSLLNIGFFNNNGNFLWCAV